MRERLPQRQNQVLEFIRDAIHRDGRPPTMAEIARGIGVRSVGGVHKMVVALEDRGLIRRTPHEARSIELLDEDGPAYPGAGYEPPSVSMLKMSEGAGRRARPLRSDTAAHPLPTSTRHSVLVDEALLPEGVDLEHCLAVRVGDDGMSGAGVWKGDVVVVEEMEGEHVPPRALAAVLHETRVVVRQLEPVDGRFLLRAADRTYDDVTVRPSDPDYFVVGHAVALLRKLG